MKYYTHILSLILSAAFLFQACSYLDVVPDETPDEKDAFQNPTNAISIPVIRSCPIRVTKQLRWI